MTIKILMPALSPTMTEGNLAKWHVKIGDRVNPGDIIAEIETDKATMEVEAADEGTVGSLLVAEGTDAVPVNETIGLLLEEGEESLDNMEELPLKDDKGEQNSTMQQTESDTEIPILESVTDGSIKNTRKVSPLAGRMASQAGLALSDITGSGDRGKIMKSDVEEAMLGHKTLIHQADNSTKNVGKSVTLADTSNRTFVTPLARRMASDAGIDLSDISGSGPEGRIIKKDISAAIEMSEKRNSEQDGLVANVSKERSKLVKLPTMRKVIAKRMTESKTQVPHFYLTMDFELGNLLKMRGVLNEAQSEVKISVNDFVIRSCALALMDVPEANVAHENENEMRCFDSADISVAVAVEGGLFTPVIRDAEKKGLRQLSLEMKELVSRARDGKLLPEEYQGGSFSISNLGMYGIRQFNAVINPPQACILAVGAAEQRPLAKNGEINIGDVMTCTLSVDHRVVDGAIGANLLARLKRYIEDPALMLL